MLRNRLLTTMSRSRLRGHRHWCPPRPFLDSLRLADDPGHNRD